MPYRKPILIAEDSVDDVLILRRAFETAGIQAKLIFVGDGQTAIDYLSGAREFADRSQHPFPKLVLLDLKMPCVDGFDVLQWRQQSNLSSVPVTVLTSSNQEGDMRRAYDLGANSFMVKPNCWEALTDLVKTLHHYWVELNGTPEVSASVPR